MAKIGAHFGKPDVGAGIVISVAETTADLTAYELYRNSSDQLLWYNGSSSLNISTIAAGGSGASDLDSAYSNGQSITLDQGAIVLTDSTTGALDMLRLTKSGAGSGDSLEFLFTGASTGRGIYMDMDLAITAVALSIDSGATARTGSDLQFTSDSTGAHSNIDINQSGAGAAIGFDWTGSYNGSPAGQVFLLTFDANDNLTTEAMQIDTSTGDRGIMFDFNFGHTDSGTTSHIWDIDVSAIIDSNIFDFATSVACTGNVFNIVMDNAIAGTAMRVTGAGVRTQPFVELISTATGSADMIDLSVDGAFTGDVIQIDMNAGVGGRALHIDAGNATRTATLVLVTFDGAGTTAGGTLMDINVTNTGAAASPLFDIDVTGVYTGNIFDVLIDAVAFTGNVINIDLGDTQTAGQLFVLDAGSSGRTTDAITLIEGGTSTADTFYFDVSGTMSGQVFNVDISGITTGTFFDVNYTAAATGDCFGITMGSNVAGSAFAITAAGARTDDLIKIDDSSTGNSHIFDINLSDVYTGNVIDIGITGAATGNMIRVLIGAVAYTGDVISVDLGDTQTIAQLAVLDAGASARTTDAIAITDDGTSTGDTISITMGGTGSGNTLDLNVSTVLFTGDVLNIDLGATATGSQAIVVASGVMTRTTDLIEINENGAASGNTINIDVGAVLYTGNLIDLNLGATAVGGQAIVIASGAMLRTTSLVAISDSGTSSGAMIDLDVTGVTTGILIDIDLTAASTGAIFDFATNAASTGTIFNVDMTNAIGAIGHSTTLAGARTADWVNIDDSNTGAGIMFDINRSGASSGLMFDIDVTGASSGNIFDVLVGTVAFTGDVLAIDLGDTQTTAQLFVLDAGASARTTDAITLIDGGTSTGDTLFLTINGTQSGHVFNIDVAGATVGNVIDITYSAISTGDAISVVMADNVVGGALVITGAGIRTDNLIEVTTSETGSVDGIMRMDVQGVFTGSALTLTASGAATTGSLLHFDLNAGVAYKAITFDHAGARTFATILTTFDGTFGATGGGTFIDANITMTGALASSFIDIDVTDVYTGNILDIVFSVAAATGHALFIDMGTNLAGNAININGAGARSSQMVLIDWTGTDAGTDDHILDVNILGLLNSNVIDIAYSSSASDGNAIFLAMGTNVAGSAIQVTTAGTGASGEGCVLDVEHSGALAAGADVITIHSTGNISSTSNLLALEQDTGAGTAGSNVLYINASGTNVEAIEINEGLFFEATVTANGAGNGESLATTANVSFYDPNGASRTGVILAPGLRDGQYVRVVNIADAAEDITFAASGTSNVAAGTAAVLSNFESRTFVWSATRSLWYIEIPT